VSENVAHLGGRWERKRLDDRFQAWVGARHHRLPPRLEERARAARSIPNVRLEIEAFNEDPILYAVRGRWIFAERVPIGAWDTGEPLLDSH
jgi:hypothetical protein